MTSRFPGLDSISPRRGRDLCEKNHIAANTVRKPRWPVDSRERQRNRAISRGKKRTFWASLQVFVVHLPVVPTFPSARITRV